MTIYECIDLSERLQNLYEEIPDFERLIAVLSKQAGYTKCQRIYFGSSFCSQYFLHLEEKTVGQLLKVCVQKEIKVSLTIPIFTEKDLDKGKNKIKSLLQLESTAIDEIVINDYGMMQYIHDTYKNRYHVAIGRLLLKDYREPRYETYFDTPYEPKLFTSYLQRLIKKYNIKAINMDSTHKIINFINKPAEIEIGIYRPYTYITVGQICELGSEKAPIYEKYRPNRNCQRECQTRQIQYFPEADRKWFKLGRTVYFENPEVTLQHLAGYRNIYCPLEGIQLIEEGENI